MLFIPLCIPWFCSFIFTCSFYLIFVSWFLYFIYFFLICRCLLFSFTIFLILLILCCCFLITQSPFPFNVISEWDISCPLLHACLSSLLLFISSCWVMVPEQIAVATEIEAVMHEDVKEYWRVQKEEELLGKMALVFSSCGLFLSGVTTSDHLFMSPPGQHVFLRHIKPYLYASFFWLPSFPLSYFFYLYQWILLKTKVRQKPATL